MTDFYVEAERSFEEELRWIEGQGRRDSPDWQLANGLLQLARGLLRDRETEAEQRKSFARSWTPPK